MTWKCTYCHTPLPAPPLPNTILWVCTPDGRDLETACCDCYFERGLYAWGRQVVSETRYHESHRPDERADEEWYLSWAAVLPMRNPREEADEAGEADVEAEASEAEHVEAASNEAEPSEAAEEQTPIGK